MVIAVNTREFKRDLDYDWEDYFPSDKSLSVEAGKILRALEGVYVDSRFAVLLRSATDVGVMLGVSVSTSRRDAVGGVGNGRPIRTIAFLRATDQKEKMLYTRSRVRIVTPDKQIEADSLVATDDFSEYTMYSGSALLEVDED